MARGRGGNFRGSGSRGRGTGGRGRGAGGRGRGPGGRGRGKSTSRWGPNRQFESARLDQQEESDSDPEESDSGDEEPSSEEEETSDKDDEDEATVKPYMALLQGFSDTTAAPSAKRRKLGHDLSASAPQPAAVEEPEAADSGEDLDAVEGGDDDLDAAADEQPEDDSEDDEDLSDPFDQHFAHPDEKTYSSLVKAAKDGKWTESQKMVGPWRATFQDAEAGLAAPPAAADLGSFKLKQKLAESAKKKMSKFGDVEKNMGPLLFGYRDILHCDRTVRNAKSMRQLVCLHALNHVMKTRDRVIKDNYKLAKDGNNPDLEFRDQGFTRPKVLFLSPTRNSCAQIVNIIRDLTEPDQQENRKRFDDSYIDTGNRFGDDKPEDFKHLFEGNDDDMFRLGLKFTRKTIKYFSQFYSSDILLASPLGLRMAIGSEEEKNKKNKLDYDFLSSIELVVVDQADALLMQNWEHVEYIFEHLNLQPTDSHDCDFSRVRSWYLEDWARHFRQTVILSAFNTPDLTGLFREHAQNWAGKVRLQPVYPGVLQQLGVKAKQTFSRFQPPSVADDPDARFKYFTSTIIPSLTKRAKDATGTLIFIPSYLDFVRVRNYFAGAQETSNISFGAISEYADVPEASRARSHFLSGRHRVLLYTERAHHFRRYQLNGVQRVIFYSLPDNHAFYQEIAGGYLAKSEQDMRVEPGRGSVRVLFSKYDAMRLERIVGSNRVGKMLKERGDTFDFV